MEKITKSSDKVLIDPNEPLILPDGTALVGRVEWFLYALCCLDYQNLPTPMSRIEEFANALITGEIPNIQPQSRAEQFFLAILDGNISDLPQPQSRSEVLLDKLARGEFDLSDVEPIQSRYELLLAYLIKNGGIGNIDYVLYEFSEAMKTMYNTVEKPFKSLELSGNTLVNCVLEDTENDDYTSFDKNYSGTSFTINGTSEGAIKSAILKGQTLVNLLDRNSMTPSGVNYTFNNGVYTINTTKTWSKMIFTPNLVKNKKYFVMLSTSISDVIIYYRDSSNEAKRICSGGECPFIFTNPIDNIANVSIEFPEIVTNGTVSHPMIIEYQDGMENWDIPYFEGMQSVKMPGLTTTGKNLWKHGDLNNFDTMFIDEIVPEGTYYFSGEQTTTYESPVAIALRDSKSNVLGYTRLGGKITINKKASQIAIYSNGHNYANSAGKFLSVNNFMMEKGSTATSYEPYKTNILSCNEEVTLRSIKNIVDELDCKTGEVTERIGEVTFKGALNEGWGQFDNSAIQEKTCLFAYYGGLPSSPSENLEMICDKFIIAKDGYLALLNTDEETVHVYTDRAVYFRVLKSKLSTQNVIGFKEWLSQNPFTIQYQLKTESIKTVDLNVVDQNNTKIDKIHVFNETTHVNASSDELTPTVNIGKSVSYPTIIKPNTKYTVVLKRNDKPLTVNLGGTEITFVDGETRKTITTPSTLTNDKLSYYGVGAKCNEIMLIEGEIERNIDYFTGMQSVVMQNQMPILSTVGKNLFNPLDLIISESQRVTCVAEPNRLSFRYKIGSHFNSSSYIQLEPNTKYWITITTKSYNKSEDEYVKLHLGKRPHHDSTEYGGFFIKASTDGTQYRSFTTDSDAKLYINGYVGSVGYDIWDIMLEKVEDSNASATPYEPYKTSILSCNDEIELNGIETYKDVLDCNNKKITRRTRKLLLNGSDDVQWNTYALNDEFPNVIGFYYTFPEEVKRYGNKYLYNGSLPPTERDVFPGNITSNEEVIVVRNNDHIKLSIYRNKLKSLNADGFKEWLSENPIELTYVLKNPIVSEVELSVIDQDGNTIPKIKSYKDVTHLEVSIPKQSLLPNVSAEVATDNSKDMSSLTIKHQEISEAQSTIEDSIQSQSDEIDTALMATTEIFESIL